MATYVLGHGWTVRSLLSWDRLGLVGWSRVYCGFVRPELECINRTDLVHCGELAKTGSYQEDRTVQPPAVGAVSCCLPWAGPGSPAEPGDVGLFQASL